jgi:hypothetical protein
MLCAFVLQIMLKAPALASSANYACSAWRWAGGASKNAKVRSKRGMLTLYPLNT